MIETFTKEEFEAALPKTDKFPIENLGVVDGEYCYILKVNEKAGIFIRSSVKSNGRSAGTGEDSIRCFLVDSKRAPFAAKAVKWTTRLPGWDGRMKDNFRYLIRLHRAAGFDTKGEPAKIFKVNKEGPNKGRYFIPETPTSHFKWL